MKINSSSDGFVTASFDFRIYLLPDKSKPEYSILKNLFPSLLFFFESNSLVILIFASLLRISLP